MSDVPQQFKSAVLESDAARLARLLSDHPELLRSLDDPVFHFDLPAIVVAAGQGKRDVIDVLLEAGANINARSKWWAGSFGILDFATPQLADYLIQRGAALDIHSASRLGMLDKVRQFVASNPASVHARGGDGQTPLHFASTVEIAEFLLDHGAAIDARDIDHESTPAQYMVKERQEIMRCLLRRGCRSDVLMAAAIGDAALVSKHLDENPEYIRMRVTEDWFPKENPKSGGTIYYWTLGKNRSPHQVASKFGHTEIVKLLLDRSPDDVRILNACLCGEEVQAKALLAEHPEMKADLLANRQAIVNAAEDNDTRAVRLMIELGCRSTAASRRFILPRGTAMWKWRESFSPGIRI